MSVAVISFTEPKTTYDNHGRLLTQKGDKVVSHGVDLDTGHTVILPSDPWESFVNQHCVYHSGSGEWLLK